MSEAESSVRYQPIKDFPGYRVGDDGSVWSCLVNPGAQRKSYIGTEWKIRIPTPTTGHGQLYLYGPNGRKRFKVYHLVLTAFSGPRPKGAFGLHKNGNPCDNRIENLYWGTPKQNGSDAVRLGESLPGEKHPNAKLTDADARMILDSPLTGAALGRKLGVNKETIYHIRNGRAWKHIHATKTL